MAAAGDLVELRRQLSEAEKQAEAEGREAAAAQAQELRLECRAVRDKLRKLEAKIHGFEGELAVVANLTGHIEQQLGDLKDDLAPSTALGNQSEDSCQQGERLRRNREMSLAGRDLGFLARAEKGRLCR